MANKWPTDPTEGDVAKQLETSLIEGEVHSQIKHLANVLEERAVALRGVAGEVNGMPAAELSKAIHDAETLNFTRAGVIRAMINQKVARLQELEAGAFANDTEGPPITNCPKCDGPVFEGKGPGASLTFCASCHRRVLFCVCANPLPIPSESPSPIPPVHGFPRNRPRPNLRDEE